MHLTKIGEISHEDAASGYRLCDSTGFCHSGVRPSVQMERSLLRLPGLSGIRLWANAVPRPNSIVIKNYCEGKIPRPTQTQTQHIGGSKNLPLQPTCVKSEFVLDSNQIRLTTPTPEGVRGMGVPRSGPGSLGREPAPIL